MSDPKKLRILMVINKFSRGGAERQLLRLVSCLRLTHDFRVVALQSGGDFAAAFKNAGIEIDELGMASGLKNIGNFAGYKKLQKITKSFQPDVIQGWLLEGNAAAVLMGKLLKIPTITSKRGSSVGFSKYRKFCEASLYRLSGHVCTNTRSLAEEVVAQGLSNDKISVIPNGIDLEVVDGQISHLVQGRPKICPEKVVVGSIGRFVFEKRYEDLFEAAKILCTAHENVHFLWVGGRGEIEFFQRSVQDAGLADRITFSGEVSDVSDLLEQMDIFVLSSSQEGMPNVVMEAMAYSKAVVGTDVGGIPELVDHDKTGYLVPVRQPELLAKSIEALVLDKKKRTLFGLAGREKIETFSTSRLGERMSSVYQMLLA